MPLMPDAHNVVDVNFVAVVVVIGVVVGVIVGVIVVVEIVIIVATLAIWLKGSPSHA